MAAVSNEPIILFVEKSQCCGCGACMNICPEQAIIMQEDSSGFLYPVINHSQCVRCGRCKKVCGYQSLLF